MKTNIQKNNKSQFSAAAACLFIAGSIFLYQPAMVYWGNQPYFSYSFGKIILWLLPFFFISYFLLWLPGRIIQIRRQRYYTAALTGIAFSMWMATLFTGNNGVLDGKSFVLIRDAKIIWFNGIFLLLVTIAAAIVGFYQAKLTRNLLFSISTLSTIFVLYVLVVGQKPPPSNNSAQLETNLVTFSKNKNVLLILLDTFEGDFFQEILNKNPSFTTEFSGFAYFPKAVGVAPTTYLSVPSIHSGQIYQAGQTVGSFYDKAVVQDSFVKAHVQSGYQGMILNNYLGSCPKDVICGTDTDIYFKNKAALSEGVLLFNLSVFKSIPHFFKRYVYNKGHWRLGDFSPSRAVTANHTLSVIASSMKTTSSVPTIKFIHLYGTHPPAMVTATCENRYTRSKWTRELAISQDTCGIAHVIKVLKSLKEQNIYDQTAIMIVGDHGTDISPSNRFVLGASANPLFLYKPFNASGDLQISNKLVGLIDVSATLCAATNDCHHNPMNGQNVLTNSANETRIFHFNRYRWTGDRVALDKPIYVVEFEIRGAPDNISSWRRLLPKSLTFRSEISFFDSSFEEYYGVGWEHEIKSFRWANSLQAEMFLPLPASKNTHIQFSVKTHSGNPGQQFAVWANNVFIGKYAVNTQETVIKLNIPGTIITQQPTHLIFKFDKLNYSPEDRRHLAVAFLDKLQIQST